jgi:DNA polymerase-3 subunit epsilon
MNTTNIQSIIKRPICFFDLETTGVEPLESRIVQIAVKKIHPDGKVEFKKRLVNPTVPIPGECAEIHGITDEMVSNEPTFKAMAKSLFEFMNGCDFAGYNSNRFDVPLLAMEFQRAGIQNPFTGCKFIDIFNLFCHFHKRNLETCFKVYTGKNMVNAHDAENDVDATVEIFESMLSTHAGELSHDMREIERTGEKFKRIDLFGKITLNKEGKRTFNFGKHKGEPICELPQSYIDWVLNLDDMPDDTKQHIKLSRNANL